VAPIKPDHRHPAHDCPFTPVEKIASIPEIQDL
jgi:hypothetical protein